MPACHKTQPNHTMKIHLTVPHLVAVTSLHVGATNYRPARLRLALPRAGLRKFIPWDHIYSNNVDMAASYIKGLTGLMPCAIATVDNAWNADTLLYKWDSEDGLVNYYSALCDKVFGRDKKAAV